MANGPIPRRDFLLSAGAGVAATVAAMSPAQSQGGAPATVGEPAGRSDPEERQRHHHRCALLRRRGDRHRRRQDSRRRPGRGDGGAYRADHPRARSQEAHRHAGPERRPRPHGPRGAPQRLPGARQGALDQGHPGPHRRARPRQAARRMGRHHADRRSALLLRHAGEPRREALADAAGARRRGAQQSGVHPLDLGLLARHVSARLLRQHRGAEARRHHPRHRLAGAVAGHPEGWQRRSDRRLHRAGDGADRGDDLVPRRRALLARRPDARATAIRQALSRRRHHQHLRGPRRRQRTAARLQAGPITTAL